MKSILPPLAALVLCGCAQTAPAVRMGVGLYCEGLTEAAKQAIRAQLTAGVAVLACPEAAGYPPQAARRPPE